MSTQENTRIDTKVKARTLKAVTIGVTLTMASSALAFESNYRELVQSANEALVSFGIQLTAQESPDRVGIMVHGLPNTIYDTFWNPPDWSSPSPLAQLTATPQTLDLHLSSNNPPDWSMPAPVRHLTSSRGVVDLDIFAWNPPDWSKPSDATVTSSEGAIDLDVSLWNPPDWSMPSPAQIEVHAGDKFTVKVINSATGQLIGNYELTSKGQLKAIR